MQIQIHQLTYLKSDHTAILSALNLRLTALKTGIVGKNGIGKTTLLKLLAGILQPSSGSVQASGQVFYCPQCPPKNINKTIASVLGIAEKIAALQRINQGSINQSDFDMLENDWNLEQRTYAKLAEFNLAHLALTQTLNNLSGGEHIRLYLSKAFLSDAEFLLLDEPSNNLDQASKQLLYQAVENWNKGLVVVTHDRELLNQMSQIIELSNLGAKVYGGNYDDYLEQKHLEQAAAENELQARKQLLKKSKSIIQQTKEKHQQSISKGLKYRKAELKAKGHNDKLLAHKRSDRSDKTQRKITTQAKRKLTGLNTQLQRAKEKIEVSHQIQIDLPSTELASNKVILEMEKINFQYPTQTKLMIRDFSLKIQGPERIALQGNNGSGKTSLIKLILGELKPCSGSIKTLTQNIAYLDQHLTGLNDQLSVLENFKRFNPNIDESRARLYLAHFLFRGEESLKKAAVLSGGERLRALLACIFMAKDAPQLLILDEPTNHLDFASLESLESALQCYRGGILVVSHDQHFLSNINITSTISLGGTA